MKPSRNIETLKEIMAALRDPETGCPWDVKQDFQSIAPYTIEEAYEVLDAILREDMDDLRDELGDLLLQVIFHARMAEEAGYFDFGDVVTAITGKMIRRHPHVFGDAQAREAGMAKGMWDRIKAEEKKERRQNLARAGSDAAPNGYLDDITLALPALTRALKLQQKAAQVGFDWGETAPVLDKIKEEIGELEIEIKQGKKASIQDEFGDVLFAMINLGRHLGIDAETALRGTNEKFRRRFHTVENALQEQGRALSSATLEDMEALWIQAKENE